MKKKEKEILKTIKNWDFHPYQEEAEVDKTPLTSHDRELIEKIKNSKEESQ